MNTGLFIAIGVLVALGATLVFAANYRRREMQEECADESGSGADDAGAGGGGRGSTEGVRARGQSPPVSAPVDGQSVLPEELANMLAEPEFLADPVFPQADYLPLFGTGYFRALLRQSGSASLVERVRVLNANPQSAMLLADHLAFWAIDLEAKSGNGLGGRDEFVERVRQPIRRPPPGMAAFTAQQHILAKGVVKIQVESEPVVEGSYQICQLKTVGWCLAALISPRGGHG